MSPSETRVSISGGCISWFIATEILTQLVQLVQGRGHHFNGGRTPLLAIQYKYGQQIPVEVLWQGLG